MDDSWELYYWTRIKEDGKNHMVGRGEFVRLMFEAAGVSYIEKGNPDTSVVFKFVMGGGNEGFPALAPPVIKRGDFVLSQTPVIMRYLGSLYGLAPENPFDNAHADQVLETVTDFVAEGRLHFHPKNFSQSYYDQIEEAKPFIARFVETRLPKFLTHFETVLKYNKESSLHVVGSKLSYADIGLFHALCASESQFPEGWAGLAEKIPLANIEKLPRIAAYLSSDRRGSFEGNSMM